LDSEFSDKENEDGKEIYLFDLINKNLLNEIKISFARMSTRAREEF